MNLKQNPRNKQSQDESDQEIQQALAEICWQCDIYWPERTGADDHVQNDASAHNAIATERETAFQSGGATKHQLNDLAEREIEIKIKIKKADNLSSTPSQPKR